MSDQLSGIRYHLLERDFFDTQAVRWERDALRIALQMIAAGHGDPVRVACVALGRPDPGASPLTSDEMRVMEEEDPDLPF
jgi:hypothetical protein